MFLFRTFRSRSGYRPDIDGLRAIAVLSVVTFHAFPGALDGGFVGVDIFFVISGFLISTILFEKLDTGTFSLVDFYARRIKRIFPALILVLSASFGFGWCVMMPTEFKQLGLHIVGGTAFISNLILWREAGYFDYLAITKPLLHLWSLGIEEQFYIAWPLILWAGWRKNINTGLLIAAIIFISFFISIFQLKYDAVGAFYSPISRAWELLCGALLAWVGTNYIKSLHAIRSKINQTLSGLFAGGRLASDINRDFTSEILSISGAAAVLFGLVEAKGGAGFPGWWALAPVLGTVSIISAGPATWINRTILSASPLVWIGLISFPLYLWHYPLLSFARIISGDTPTFYMRVMLVILAVVLAWITYQVVELPIRMGRGSKLKMIALVISMIGLSCVGFGAYWREGLASRHFVALNSAIKSGEDGGPGPFMVQGCGSESDYLTRNVAYCLNDSRGPARFALLGDSHAAALYPGLIRTSSDNGRWLFIGGNGPSGPPVPVISNSPIYKRYQSLIVPAAHAIADSKEVETVVLVVATRALFQLKGDRDIEDLPSSANYSVALDGLRNTVSLFKSAGKKVVLVEDNPTLPAPEDCLMRETSIPVVNKIFVRNILNCTVPLKRQRLLASNYYKLLEVLKQEFPDTVSVFYTYKYLCDIQADACLPKKNGRLLYSYTDHISDYASGLIGKPLNDFLNNR